MITIRDFSLNDCKALAVIDRQVFSQPLSEQGFKNEYNNKNSLTLVAEYDNEIAGYINLWTVCGEVNINNIAVSEKFRRQGIGKSLMKAAFQRLGDSFEEYQTITLEVRISNNIAMSMYEKFGFEKIGQRKDFYLKPTEDAVILARKL